MYFASNAINNDEEKENETNIYVDNAFKALADMIIPRSPELAQIYGRIQYYGALDLHTDEYMVMSLNSLTVPLALPTAEILDEQSRKFINRVEQNMDFSNPDINSFSMVSFLERQQILGSIYENKEVDYLNENSLSEDEYIFSNISSLNRMAMMGYYSEWSGYGLTRLMPPSMRKLEYYPLSWRQVEYPGPSFGYRLSRSFNLYIN